MGGIVKAIGGLFSGLMGGGGSSKSEPVAPNVEPAKQEVKKEEAKVSSIAQRTALLETAGGAAGSPLQPGEVQKTQTLFAN